MHNDKESTHLYQRTVNDNDNDSLATIASLIEPGQTILDLGMGTGGLARFISNRFSIVADGVTLSQDEADMARDCYRYVHVADLDHDDLRTLFGDQQYDCIVCADVLEHIKTPQNLLTQCRTILKPGGRLISSIPNVAYCGLIAELLQGDFQYRHEGLLDKTHLHFYTRTSLQRFFAQNGWFTESVRTTQRNLLESEFHAAFDGFPPSVARYLLALPDAQTYQFIHVLRTTQVETSVSPNNLSEVVDAWFSAQLYLGTLNQYDEAKKLVAPGRIGISKQSLVFNIPASHSPYTQIRLDPADRPGYFRLFHIEITFPDSELAWSWNAQKDPLTTLTGVMQQDFTLVSPWDTAEGVLLLLQSDDPWLVLPLPEALLAKIAHFGAKLEICAGWPMSSDYLQASREIIFNKKAHQLEHEKLQSIQEAYSSLQHERIQLNEQFNAFKQASAHTLDQISRENKQSRNELKYLLEQLRDEKRRLVAEMRSVQRERNSLAQQLEQQRDLSISYRQSIENSNIFRLTRPLVHIKMHIDRLLSPKEAVNTLPKPPVYNPIAPSIDSVVDVIVPVYRGLDDTRCCLESVLASRCETKWRLIVINDCSPESEINDWLRVFAQRDPRIILLENEENLGFVGTVNRGMEFDNLNDVLLLNSDAEVANNWLDRIQRAAYSAPRVASVTPFSNNATICSYPRFCESNDLPNGCSVASLDDLFAKHLEGKTVEIPTGVGFCMYIRRACLDEIGLFDVENFGKGYGEENDFCVRAQNAGWSNLHALDTFVRHAGGISFGDSKSARELSAMQTIRRLHPQYENDVIAYVQRDPAQFARRLIDLARISDCKRPVILNVLHNRGGGTLRHVQELAQTLADQACFLRLTPAPGGVDLRLEGAHEALSLYFALPGDGTRLLDTLCQFQVAHIHYHHLLDHAPEICNLPSQLGVTHDFTVHDYFSYCPQISLTDHTDRYCGEKGIEQCHRCLERNPAPTGEGIEQWRQRHARLLTQARFVIAPSADVQLRMQRFLPTARICVVPHATLHQTPTPYPNPVLRSVDQNTPLKIVVLGALGKIKGADMLEEVATLSAKLNAPLEFHLLGYAYRNMRTQPKARLTVHGSYEERDLPKLLQWLQPDLVWFPAQCPETYSYTLSTSLECGLPVVAPNIGAFASRLQNREWTWICDWQQSAQQWLTFFTAIRKDHFCTLYGPKVPHQTDRPSEIIESIFSYHKDYLQNLPPKTFTTQVQDLANQLAPLTRKEAPITHNRSIALRIINRLRDNNLLPPLGRFFPLAVRQKITALLSK